MRFLDIDILCLYCNLSLIRHGLGGIEQQIELSSGILLYGISLLYGATNTLYLPELSRSLSVAILSGDLLSAVGWILLAIGLFFKVSAAPFHVWTPDVYVGAPTPVTGYLAVASKAASFAILVRIFYQGLAPLVIDWQIVVAAVATLSMIWGNIAALTQTNVKRMLAYSSIAHAGYALMGLVAFNEMGAWALLMYMLAGTLVEIVFIDWVINIVKIIIVPIVRDPESRKAAVRSGSPAAATGRGMYSPRRPVTGPKTRNGRLR